VSTRARSNQLRAPRRTIRLRLTVVYAGLFLLSGAVLLGITYVLVDNVAPSGPQVLFGGRSAAGALIGVSGAVQPGACVTAGGTPPNPALLQPCVTFLQRQVVAQRADDLNALLVDSGIALAVMTVGALGLGWLVSGRVLSPLRTITAAARTISASSLHQRLALDGPDDELKELGDTVDGLLGRLESSFAAQRQFVANASHELRTPLARQRTLAEVALADPDRSVASLEAAFGRVLAAGQQQEKIIEALLTLARSQRGLDQCELVDLAAIAGETTLARSAEAAAGGVTVTVQNCPVAFPGDVRLAERLVANLLDNAVRHNYRGGDVLVQTALDRDEAVLVVTNSGPLIDQADVGHLFEPFRRGRERRTGGGDSPGLGLSIVYAIVAAHGASLWATTRPEGGLEIQVRFPLAEVARATSVPSMPGPRSESDCGLRAGVVVEPVQLVGQDPAHGPRRERALEEAADPAGTVPPAADPHPAALLVRRRHGEGGDRA
jgi:signal transduction histidine kinase